MIVNIIIVTITITIAAAIITMAITVTVTITITMINTITSMNNVCMSLTIPRKWVTSSACTGWILVIMISSGTC